MFFKVLQCIALFLTTLAVSPLMMAANELAVDGLVTNSVAHVEIPTDNVNMSLNRSYTTVSAGFGHARAQVIPNTDNQFFDGNGLSLGIGLATEKPLSEAFTLTARADVFSSFSFSTLLSDATSSWGGMISAGVLVGNLRQSGQLFIAATVGVGFAALSDQGLNDSGDSICILCSGQEGGTSYGIASRLAIGYAANNGRIELVWMRVGGEGQNEVYINGEEVFLDTFQVQLSSRGYTVH